MSAQAGIYPGTEQKPLHINRLTISNFMQVKLEQIDAEGGHVLITGPNASGKTSRLEAIWAALKGVRAKDVPEPIRRGADKGSVTLDLGEYIVERRWTEKSDSLIIRGADGSKIPKGGQQLLDGLLSVSCLDPVAFMSGRPQDQVDLVLAVAGVRAPVVKVEELTGEKHELRAGESASTYLERLSADTTGLYYDRRRQAGQVVDQKRHALEEQRGVLSGLGGELTGKHENLSAASTLDKIQALQLAGDERRTALEEAAEAARDHVGANDRLEALKAEQEVERDHIDKLGKELRARSESFIARTVRIDNGNKVVAEYCEEAKRLAKVATELPDHSEEIAELRSHLHTIEGVNKALSARQHAQEQRDRLAKDVEAADAEHKRFDEILEKLRDLRVHLLDGLNLGVDGLEVGQGELKLNGVSFRQASQAEQTRVSMAVAMKQKPRLRLIRIDGGESLDRHSKEIVFKMAAENDFQVVMAAVADTDALRVEIVEGQRP